MSSKITASEFRDAGYLVEVNRRVLHPLGLALAVDVGGNTFSVLDDRGDPEGWYYAYGDDQPEGIAWPQGLDLDVELEAKVRNVAALEAERVPARKAALGYVVQPIARFPDTHADSALLAEIRAIVEDIDGGGMMQVTGHRAELRYYAIAKVLAEHDAQQLTPLTSLE